MRQALGKGIGALIPSASPRKAVPTPAEPSGRNLVHDLPIDAIDVNPRQPRHHFDEQALEDLARSIAETGVLQPVLVRKISAGRFELVAGERRLRACRKAGLKEIPAVVRESSDSESLMLAIVENVQRADLGALEEARAYQALIDEFELTQEEVARRVGKTRPAVSNSLRLLQLPEDTQAEIAAGRLTAGHARALLSVESDQARSTLAKEIVHRNLNVREAERAASRTRAPASPPRRDPDVTRIEADLSRALGTKVRIVAARGGKGSIEIEYYSDDDLGRLVERLTGGPGARRRAASS
jgi:ParB family transcriptional regulator, chromosome partitioning protein